MATFRNDTGHDLTIDRFGLYVPDGATFEIPDDDADSLAGQHHLVPVDGEPEVLVPAEIARDLVGADATSEPADVASEPAAAADAPADGPSEAPTAEEPAPATTAVVEPEPEPEAETPAEPAAPADDVDPFTQL